MTIDLNKLFQLVLLTFGLSASGCMFTALPGCTIALHGEGEVGFAQDTEWKFYHRAKTDQNGEQLATSELHSQPVEDWIKSKSQNAGQDVADQNSNGVENEVEDSNTNGPVVITDSPE